MFCATTCAWFSFHNVAPLKINIQDVFWAENSFVSGETPSQLVEEVSHYIGSSLVRELNVLVFLF